MSLLFSSIKDLMGNYAQSVV